MSDTYLFALLNLAISIGIVSISLCRLNSMLPEQRVLFRVRLEYAGYIGGSIANGLQPMWGEYPFWGTCSLALAVLIGLICSSNAWKGDRAPESATDRAPLGEK